MSFAAGALAMVAFESMLRSNQVWMVYAGVTVVMLVTVTLNAGRLLKTLPS